MGVRYIGGCCGFEPYHIRAIAEEVGIIFKLNEYRAYWETLIRKKSNCCSQRVKLPVPKIKKGLGTSVHIVKITSY